MDSFSRRQGYSRPDAEISNRHEAPESLRAAIVPIAYRSGFAPSGLHHRLCDILYKTPDKSNWSEYPNIDDEVRILMDKLEWFEVYDFIEHLAEKSLYKGGDFSGEVNSYFRVAGIGWQLLDQKIQMRGTEAFDIAVKEGQLLLSLQHRTTAAYELHEALQDLSRRPQPEISGAIQHAMATLECVARDVIGSKDTLGQLIQRDPGLFPKPVDQIVEKAWAYSSNFGRHLMEKKPPEFEEAELMVGVSGVLCRYLARRTGNSTL
ncbi:AbiJ-NTD4 domain-containing protein [Klebsiella pneumoniae]|uniref:AbiJ-NTD4 domain-containing protein n=1 Tax=Klebsiella pneumoniae TaxID=573 RepID=UPI001EE8EFEF|nr:hypothetical protein [Klebsiella pneumoniae]MCG5610386.1 hypothetical protein [Klebsiella pneumoniae]